jgi:hypothetical protein
LKSNSRLPRPPFIFFFFFFFLPKIKMFTHITECVMNNRSQMLFFCFVLFVSILIGLPTSMFLFS